MLVFMRTVSTRVYIDPRSVIAIEGSIDQGEGFTDYCTLYLTGGATIEVEGFVNDVAENVKQAAEQEPAKG